MADYQSKVPLQLQELIQQSQLSRNEICCKLRELITLAGGGSNTTVLLPGVVKLTSGGTSSFSTASPIQGTSYKSINLTVISLTTGTVTVTDAHGATAVSYVGFNAKWDITPGSTLSIAVTGDAVAIISYTAE